MSGPKSERDATGRAVSLQDVATTAGVSKSTVSRVLSGSSHPVSSTTRARVLEVADELGFEPNRVARALATARTQTIGVVVHDIADPYFAEIVRGLEEVAGPRDHAIFVASADRELADELALIRTFVANRVDAIVLVASGVDDPRYASEVARHLGAFEDRGGVVVKVSEHPYDSLRVRYSNDTGMASVVQHLEVLGHKRIAHISGPPQLLVSKQRKRGYRDALTDRAGIADLDECGWFSIEGGAEAASRLMDRAQPPTAIAAGNDLMAIGAMRRLLEMGYGVPTDVSVTGFDDIEFSTYASVPLTTVHVPLRDLGRRGAEIVMTRLDHPEEPAVSVDVDVELVVRASTARPIA